MSDFEFGDAPRHRRPPAGRGGAAFTTTFFGSLGCLAAPGLALLLVVVVCAGLASLGQQPPTGR